MAAEVRFQPIGPEDPERGAPTQMAIFSRQERAAHEDSPSPNSFGLLVGPSGSGESSFGQAISSDWVRLFRLLPGARCIDDENDDQSRDR